MFWYLDSYHPRDSGPFSASNSDVIHNYGGSNGAVIADILLNIIGYLSYLIPIGFGICRLEYLPKQQSCNWKQLVWHFIKAGGFVLLYCPVVLWHTVYRHQRGYFYRWWNCWWGCWKHLIYQFGNGRCDADSVLFFWQAQLCSPECRGLNSPIGWVKWL